MPLTNKTYDVYIFDCDGVILDSNQLKIEAMKSALADLSFPEKEVEQCVTYFANNFGRSRFHHVDIFVQDILQIEKGKQKEIKEHILSAYSLKCKDLYLSANLTPNFIDMIVALNGKKYVASGSEQSELRDIFHTRGLEQYFTGIFGSPTSKAELVKNILDKEPDKRAVMIGDAISDLEAAKINKIDFIAYLPFSNVKDKLTSLSLENNSPILSSWSEL